MSVHENGIHVVWFKRDLRVHDHAPLCHAARSGPVVCLYVYEPEWFAAPQFDPQHLRAVNDSLADLEVALVRLGGKLCLRMGSVVSVLDELHSEFGVAGLWSHEETGLDWSYRRDKQVAAWARRCGVSWREFRQHGVFRPHPTRDGWSRRWEMHMRQAPYPVPAHIQAAKAVESEGIVEPGELGLPPLERPEILPCGRDNAQWLLQSFLRYRGESYNASISSPVTAFNGCSRLSSALSYGNLSMREVYQASQRRMEQLSRERTPQHRAWLRSLRSHGERLRWHCHFMQKLEDEPAIEFHNMNRAYDGLREDGWNEASYQAWANGRTGYPMVDACMRALQKGGWINFRMRAMLISFASYHLWLHWRRPAQRLARLFQDFEPGIHYAQTQMQAGTTGINAARIYSPLKQAQDQDPGGVFIRRYCRELCNVPDAYIAEPHKMPLGLQRKVGCVIGRDYPPPVVEHVEAYQAARWRMDSIRRSLAAKTQARAVYQRHGSRRHRRPGQREGVGNDPLFLPGRIPR